MANAGTVTVDFAAEVAKFNAQMKTVQSSLSRLEGGFQTIAKVAKTALGFFSVGIATNFIRSAAEAADQLGKTADKLGISTERLTVFQLAAEDAGVETSTLNKLLTDAQRILGDAAFGGPAAKTIKALGLSISELERLSPDELFLKYADSIGQLNSRSEQFSVAQDLFGKSAQEAFTLIDAGRPAIDEAAENVERLGLALSRVEIKQIEIANDKIGLLGKTSQAAGQQIAVSLAPFISAIADSLLNSGIAADKLKTTIDVLVSTGYVGFQILKNGVLAIESAFFGVTGAVAGFLSFQTRLATLGFENSLSKALSASADVNIAKAKDALDGIQSFAQIQESLIAILEASRVKAELAVAETQGKIRELGTPQENQIEEINASLLIEEDLRFEHYERMLEHKKQFLEASAKLEKDLDVGEFIRHQKAREQAVIESESIMLQTRTDAQNAALGLLQTFAGRSKAAAIALVAIGKALSIAQAIQNTAVAFTKALAIDPTGALAARVALLGKIQIGLIAATGLAEASQISSSASAGAPLGSPTNPVFTNDRSGEQTFGAPQSATNIYINGLISQDLIDDLVSQLRDRDRRGVVIFRSGGNQANEIRKGG